MQLFLRIESKTIWLKKQCRIFHWKRAVKQKHTKANERPKFAISIESRFSGSFQLHESKTHTYLYTLFVSHNTMNFEQLRKLCVTPYSPKKPKTLKLHSWIYRMNESRRGPANLNKRTSRWLRENILQKFRLAEKCWLQINAGTVLE